jgi:hypothetical protein
MLRHLSGENMNTRRALAGLAVAAILFCARIASAQFTITITVDENAHGTLTNTNGFNSALPVALLPDPGPGGLAAALTYGLLNPPGLVAGDLLMVEPPPTLGQLSDIIRFNPNENGGSLVFYSDQFDADTNPADTGFPAALYTNTATFVEVGPEGLNGLTYTPTAGQPGFAAGAGGPVTYVIQSDVPEPVSLSGLTAVAGVCCIRRRRRQRC